MSKEKDIAEENDQPTLNSDAVQDNPELQEAAKTEEQKAATEQETIAEESDAVAEVEMTQEVDTPTVEDAPGHPTEAQVLEGSAESNAAVADHIGEPSEIEPPPSQPEVKENYEIIGASEVEEQETTTEQETVIKQSDAVGEVQTQETDTPIIEDTPEQSAAPEVLEDSTANDAVVADHTEEPAETEPVPSHTVAEESSDPSHEQHTNSPTSNEATMPTEPGESVKANHEQVEQASTEHSTEANGEVSDTPAKEEKPNENKAISTDTPSEDGESGKGKQDSETQEHPEVEEEEIDYTTLSKEELLEAIASISNDFTIKKASKALNEIKGAHDVIFKQEREEALKSFLVDGAEEADFAFKGDEVDGKIEEYLKIIREKRSQHFHQLEKQKESNLKVKEGLLEALRALVHEEESTASINVLKDLQEQWRNSGPVHPQHNKTLWANYHALVNQFYDQRSIYFELKELDRKKNLEAKVEICVKAEELQQLQNFNEAVKKLNELHDEYKHIGPVPRDSQEALWSRFKAASDNIYAKRKEFVSSLKETLNKNLEKKIIVADKVQEFVKYESDKISGWNQKTKELLAIQKEWEAIGSMPKENAKEINKRFWGNFKAFFHRKSEFFKSLESKREENLQLKQALVDKALALQDSEDWEGTANELKSLQQQWKEVGPVPEKDREPIYQAFKAACDGFFNNRREHNKSLESSYEGNLKKKEEVCAKLEKMAESLSVEPDQVYALQDEFSNLGFVPKRAIRSIQKRYKEAIEAVTKNADNLDEETRNELSSIIRINNLRSGPNSDQKISRQEHALKRKITHLENDISTWKNNMGFFANSKNAEELMKDFSKKIEDSEQKLQALKDELRFLSRLE